ncbi:nuclear transport factor 2 family protein [Dyella flava]|uniref:Nuclear transport factor 2 family protein n=1 Tax=Dyella flava TaxID=1920170 RepID=A0ABS2JY89_9GAMM|nr:nuclear transport factor 2 family protein [Dyella flava]MBM7123960.1 nuclear transport factor 2 family protein [Dyella flava]
MTSPQHSHGFRSKSARSNNAAMAIEVTVQRPAKYQTVMSRIAVFAAACVLVGQIPISMAAGQAKAAAGPTAENALAADERLAQAIQDNDATAILRLLDDSWAVIATSGGVGEGPSVFPDGIKSGHLTRKTYQLSEPRVRIYGDIALVTSKVETAGVLQGKPFDVAERQTDVWRWANGAWKCVLTHETKIKNN